MNSGAQELMLRELRDTIQQLNKVIQKQTEEFNAAIAELKELLAKRDAQIAAQEQELRNKQEQIDSLRHALFGKSSEKRSRDDGIPGQLSLDDVSGDVFNEVEAESDTSAPEPDAEDVLIKARLRRKKPTFEERYGNLPTVKVVHELPEDQRVCDTCGTPLEKVGEKFVRREFEVIPRQVKVIEHYEATYKCPGCEAANDTTYSDRPFFVTAKAPEPLIPHSMASPSVIAMIICGKFVSGLPLKRQEDAWKHDGVPLSRATMGNWVIFCARNHFLVMYEFFHRCLLKRKYLMADETTVQVLKEPERPAPSKSYMWMYRTGEDGEPPIMLFEYQKSRKGANAAEFLKGFQGFLETDGYAGYNKVEGITRCCCWAHVRRKFLDAIPVSMRKQPDNSLPAVQGFNYIEKLFHIERGINERADFSYEKRYELRLRKEKPVLEAFWAWAEKQEPVKGSKFETALKYAANRKEELMNYLKDGHCSMHNNDSERLAKAFVVGRKNWLFADTPKGADASAVCYTMVEIAKANHISPFRYIQYLLEQRPDAAMSDEELSRFAPWSKEIQQALAK